jgi:hypothetical protein
MEAPMPHSALKHPPDSSTAPAGYEDDFVLWVEHQVSLLRLRQIDELDVANVIEELGDMGKNRQHELRSRLEVLMMHLLKCEFQPEHGTKSWLRTILIQRKGIADLIEESPSLRRYLAQYAQARYKHAVHLASIETDLSRSEFPVANPYSIEQLLDEDFIP